MIRVVKPSWICHQDSKGNRNAIYSIDVQPNEYRIATAGGDATVKLWQLEHLISTTTPELPSESLLATLCNHTKSVNVVRWSSDGIYLASGSDDHYILIYQRNISAQSSQPFGAPVVANKENWSRCLTLQGHGMDVLDVAWSAANLLASASIDNKVMIWNCSNISPSGFSSICAPLLVLQDHTSFVKGVAFDPLGVYLSTLSADNKCIVYNATKQFAVETIITEPLQNSIDKSIFRRHSWAPDGTALSLCSAVKNNKAIGTVLKRKIWETAADLIGHVSSTTCCKFNPKLLRHSSGAICCVIAVGDQLGTLSVWSSAETASILVIEDVFNSSIVDITWRGTTLIAASVDGSIAVVVLDDLIGDELPDSEKEQHLRRIYGDNLPMPTAPMRTSQQQLPTTTANPVSITPILHSTITVTKSGKKRLQPTLIVPAAPTTNMAMNGGYQSSVISPPAIEKPSGIEMTFYRDRTVYRLRSARNMENGMSVPVRNAAATHTILCRSHKHSAPGVSQSSVSTVTRVDDKLVTLWETSVVADVTACSALCDSNSCAESDGIVIIGCNDGCVHLLSVAAGVHLLPPLVLGSSIMHVDVTLNAEETEKGLLLMASSILGDVTVWSYHRKYRNGLQLRYRTSLECLLVSMTMHCDGACRDAVVESILLDGWGGLRASVWSRGTSECFQYCPNIGTWMRVGISLDSVESSYMFDAQLSSLQPKGVNEIIGTARLLNGDINSSNSAKEYSQRCTIANIEERLGAAVVMRCPQEFRRCLEKWVLCCCKEQQLSKLMHFCKPQVCASWLSDNVISQLLGMNKDEVIDTIIVPAIENSGNSELCAGLRDRLRSLQESCSMTSCLEGVSLE